MEDLPGKRDRVFKSSGLDDDLFETNSVASANECTGLTPYQIFDEEAAESYTDIYDIPIEKIEGKDKEQIK